MSCSPSWYQHLNIPVTAEDNSETTVTVVCIKSTYLCTAELVLVSSDHEHIIGADLEDTLLAVEESGICKAEQCVL